MLVGPGTWQLFKLGKWHFRTGGFPNSDPEPPVSWVRLTERLNAAACAAPVARGCLRVAQAGYDVVTADTATDLERAVEDLTAASGGGGWRFAVCGGFGAMQGTDPFLEWLSYRDCGLGLAKTLFWTAQEVGVVPNKLAFHEPWQLV